MDFNEERHEYSENGVIVPSVTQILKKAGYIDDRFYNDEARDRGSAVHTFCEMYAKGERKDKKGRNLAELEYVNSFALWMHESMAYELMTEMVVSGTINGRRYAGKFDGIFEINGKRVLIDIKTGAKAKWHPIQLSAYSMATLESGEKVNIDLCAVLYLHSDGTYKFDKMTSIDLVNGMTSFKEAIEK